MAMCYLQYWNSMSVSCLAISMGWKVSSSGQSSSGALNKHVRKYLQKQIFQINKYNFHKRGPIYVGRGGGLPERHRESTTIEPSGFTISVISRFIWPGPGESHPISHKLRYTLSLRNIVACQTLIFQILVFLKKKLANATFRTSPVLQMREEYMFEKNEF